jgi:hypothetical protein
MRNTIPNIQKPPLRMYFGNSIRNLVKKCYIYTRNNPYLQRKHPTFNGQFRLPLLQQNLIEGSYCSPQWGMENC